MTAVITATPTIPVQTRSDRFKSLQRADFPDVTGREVDWKFTPVAKIRDLIDGELDGSPYPILYPEIPGTTVEWVDRSDSRVGTAGIPEDKASANAWGAFQHALHISVEG